MSSKQRLISKYSRIMARIERIKDILAERRTNGPVPWARPAAIERFERDYNQCVLKLMSQQIKLSQLDHRINNTF